MQTFESLRESFTSQIPTLEKMAASHFRHLKSEGRQEAIQNTICLTWKYYKALCDKGRGEEPEIIENVLWYSIKQTKVGRSISGVGRRGRGMMNAYTAAKRGATDVEYTDFNQFIGDTTPVPDQVAFLIDMPRFLSTLTDKQRNICLMLAEGMRTGEIAKQLGVTPAVISQCKALFKIRYDAFFSEAA